MPTGRLAAHNPGYRRGLGLAPFVAWARTMDFGDKGLKFCCPLLPQGRRGRKRGQTGPGLPQKWSLLFLRNLWNGAHLAKPLIVLPQETVGMPMLVHDDF